MTIGRPRPLPGYPTTLALYPISVRRVRVQGHRLPSDPTSRWAPLPSLAVPVITARGGLAPLTSTTCLAHNRNGRLTRAARSRVLATRELRTYGFLRKSDRTLFFVTLTGGAAGAGVNAGGVLGVETIGPEVRDFAVAVAIRTVWVFAASLNVSLKAGSGDWLTLFTDPAGSVIFTTPLDL